MVSLEVLRSREAISHDGLGWSDGTGKRVVEVGDVV